MINMNNGSYHGQYVIKIKDLLIWCFSIWPFFWSLWGSFKISMFWGGNIPLYILWALSITILLLYGRFKKSCMFIWILFIFIVAIESFENLSLAIADLTVILSGVIFCLCLKEKKINYQVIIKCLIVCGMIISISVILDSTLGVFNNLLIDLYTEDAKLVKDRFDVTGGLLPHTGSAGCFIYSGGAAYITYTINKKKKWVKGAVVIMVFGLAAVLIQKRGFIIDVVIAIILIKCFQVNFSNIKTVNVRNLIKKTGICLFTIIVLAFLYFRIDFINEAVGDFIGRFTMQDETMSGRTDLYSLAFALYSGNLLTGIGWGEFRHSTLGIFGEVGATYEVHNVYLQLLCETGVLGLGLFLLATITPLVYGVIKYKKIMILEASSEYKNIIQLGLFMQLFFLAYCMSGNPLYDYNFLITYFIGILLTFIPTTDKETNLCE